MRGDVPAVFDAPDLPAWLVAGVPATDPSPLTSHAGAARLPTPSRDEFVAVWTTVGGSVRAAARHFGRDRRQIYRWLDTHGLRSEAIDD